MKNVKKFELAWNILVHSKLRSWLTIIGIIIGIAAVVAIVSISNGAQQQLKSRLNTFGTDQITISPGFSRASGFGGGDFGGGRTNTATTASNKTPELTSRDLLAIESVDNVKTVAPRISSREDTIYSAKTSTISIVGLNPEDQGIIINANVSQGRLLTKSDTYSAVIGGRIASGVFSGMQINRQIQINGKTFKIVGILGDGNTIYIPLSNSIGVLQKKKLNTYDSLIAVTVDPTLVENTTKAIEEKLMLTRGIIGQNSQDFTVSNLLAQQQTITSTVNSLAMFLGAIAAISLLVGGIGIANTMFTSVLEKTKEIGTLKSIGAKNSDVMSIFLINSGLIGLVGGIGGVTLGSIASILIGSMGGVSSTTGGGGIGRLLGNTALTPGLIIFSLIFSILIGMIAGTIPAYRASRLKPVEALRYE